ncbi:MAG TPA: methyltransferase domain-containing protein [Puia sp.]|nr:methyltransferase domain-containing protein [Puia sp.]
MDFSTRSYQAELLDAENIPFDDIAQNMKELETINHYLGGHKVTVAGFRELAAGLSSVSVCEIGCGGGDNLRVLQSWCQEKRIAFQALGIDINPDCIRVAEASNHAPGIRFMVADYRSVTLETEKPDILFSSLFCHHFPGHELVPMLHWMRANSRVGFFINDLHRHALAYYSIRLLTAGFSKSYLVKNDAPLSVRRGFSKTDWLQLLHSAGIREFSLRWKWAFRWLITVHAQTPMA